MKKIENYQKALLQLSRAAAVYGENPDDTLYRDGLIQRYEFTVELAWKSMKEYLEDQGLVLERSTPKAVLKEAYAAGVITGEDVWLAILNARNLTSHLYDEAVAFSIAEQVCRDFLPVLQALGNFYRA